MQRNALVKPGKSTEVPGISTEMSRKCPGLPEKSNEMPGKHTVNSGKFTGIQGEVSWNAEDIH